MKSFLTLFIYHNIFLTPNQRRDLANRDSLSVVGVSVPVWFANGKTNEPAEEVFCKYLLHNFEDLSEEVMITENGYELNLPQLPEGFMMPIDVKDDEWELFDINALRERLDLIIPVNGEFLRDVKEGGSEIMNFVRIGQNRIREVDVNIVHTFHIADISLLKNSLT